MARQWIVGGPLPYAVHETGTREIVAFGVGVSETSPVIVALTATGIATGAPTVGTPAVTQIQSLIATGIATGAPTVGAPELAQVQALAPDGIATGAPTVGAPNLSQSGGETPQEPQRERTGGAMPGRTGRLRAGSGRWVRVDSDAVTLKAAPARGRGRTSTVALSRALAPDRAIAQGRTSAVALSATATLTPQPALARGHTPPVRLTRDDTAEIARLIGLLPKAKRLTVTPPADVKDLYDLIDKMKKKAA